MTLTLVSLLLLPNGKEMFVVAEMLL